jgi:RNA polymerase sigma-70 factor (ECF subfamily)
VTYQSRLSDLQKDRLEALAHCIDKLNEQDRRMLQQCYAADRDYRQIAQTEGKTLAAIYKAVSRIRKALYMCVQRAIAAK